MPTKPIPRAGVVVKHPSAIGYNPNKSEPLKDFEWSSKSEIFNRVGSLLSLMINNDVLIEKNVDNSQNIKRVKSVNKIIPNPVKRKSTQPGIKKPTNIVNKNLNDKSPVQTFSPRLRSKIKTANAMGNKPQKNFNFENLIFSPQPKEKSK